MRTSHVTILDLVTWRTRKWRFLSGWTKLANCQQFHAALPHGDVSNEDVNMKKRFSKTQIMMQQELGEKSDFVVGDDERAQQLRGAIQTGEELN